MIRLPRWACWLIVGVALVGDGVSRVIEALRNRVEEHVRNRERMLAYARNRYAQRTARA